MKKLSNIVNEFINGNKTRVTMDELIGYPKESLGFHVGSFLFTNSYEADPQPELTDIHRVLITKEVSNKEEIAMHCYLFGNGDLSLKTVLIAATGSILYPQHLKYFYKKYRDGKHALRFYDLDHFRMLHLPIQRIKDTFLIR